jgi:hypothetical protein
MGERIIAFVLELSLDMPDDLSAEDTDVVMLDERAGRKFEVR